MAGELKTADEIRETVRDRYGAAAREATEGQPTSCGSGDSSCGCASDPFGAEQGVAAFGGELYADAEGLLSATRETSLGCGNPTAVAELHDGETVLDLGSGGGLDVLISAQRVGRTGRAYGLDMTDEMLELARRHQSEAGIENVEWLKGTIEKIPLPDDSIDVVISNCVINLSADKTRVFAEAARVLRPGGRFAVTDIVADPDMDESTRRDMEQWTGCIAGALTEDAFRQGLEAAGFEEVEVTATHRVHEQASSAVIRARVQ
jgi:arsenite methyltransferase